MHAAAWGALRSTRRSHLWCACRVIAGVRRPLPSRNFHRSAIAYRIPDDPAVPTNGTENGNPKNVTEDETNNAPEESATTEPEVKTDTSTGGQRARQRGDYGSVMRRANRNARVKEVPPMLLPEWFLEHNIRPSGVSDKEKRLNIIESEKQPDLAQASLENTDGGPDSTPEAAIEDSTVSSDRGTGYSVDRSIINELVSRLRTSLSLRPPQGVDSKEVLRPDILLQCPQHDGTAFMNQLIHTVACDLKADVVKLDPDDIAQIVGEYMGENVAWTSCTTSLLGYEADKVNQYEEEMNRHEEEVDEAESEEGEDSHKPDISNIAALTNALKAGSAKLRGLAIIPGAGAQRMPKPVSFDELFGQGVNQRPARSTSSSEAWSNFKLNAALEALVDAAHNKAIKQASVETTGDFNSMEISPSKRTIIQINQYKEMGKVESGINILKMLRDIVKKKWLEGRNIVIVGTTTAADPVPANTHESIVQLQSDIVYGDHQTIMVTPSTSQNINPFKIDERNRIRQINIRHIKDMVAKLSSNTAEPLMREVGKIYAKASHDSDLPASQEPGLDVAGIKQDLEGSVWPYARVHRIATIVLGLSEPASELSEPDPKMGDILLLNAYETIMKSDAQKEQWMREEEKRRAPAKSSSQDTPTDQKPLKQLKVSKHEQKLLGGVVHASNIKISFDDVRAPAETIDALKTLTSLSLVRPEAFSYGVLAKDKIPGVLLYGPPGTGKTMLAKALAKESDTTVLEVSGSEIYDKYVGEGEKNVKAVFSLAKKLSPCIVFIDEADAIFGDRGAGHQRTSHREIINQFLREWDGMNDLSAFIMVATNRPFDLDEAILRRLPRRLLIDLPIEADREAILKIHLKDEKLDESVSFAALAANTPFYSGSDLKNLSVAAALACVREENAAAAAEALAAGHEASELSKNLKYPEKRTLHMRHFDIATQEISASVSEDMQTLTAIRKFDERYGDRKGRRKKKPALGFGRENDALDEESVRVRQKEEAGKGA